MIIRPLTDRKWRGYSFDELQDQRILNDARIAIQKSVLEDRFKALKPGGMAKEASKGIFAALGYMDYVMLAISVFRKIRPLLRLFRRKKK